MSPAEVIYTGAMGAMRVGMAQGVRGIVGRLRGRQSGVDADPAIASRREVVRRVDDVDVLPLDQYPFRSFRALLVLRCEIEGSHQVPDRVKRIDPLPLGMQGFAFPAQVALRTADRNVLIPD